MRTENIEIELVIPYPINKPDDNGAIYSREAVENAVEKMKKGIPIIFRGRNDTGDGIVIGNTVSDAKIIGCDIDRGVCNVSVKGIIYAGGSDCMAQRDNGVITDFSVIAFGISTKHEEG